MGFQSDKNIMSCNQIVQKNVFAMMIPNCLFFKKNKMHIL